MSPSLLLEDLAKRLSGSCGTDPAAAGTLMPAAVLVLLVRREEADGKETLTVLLTRRTDHLIHHPGQISFPGGRFEDEDEGDPCRCALRETQEEIGIDPSRVRLLGFLPPWCTVGSGFRIQPVVGVVSPPLDLKPDPFEVAEILEPPLDWLMDPEHHVRSVHTHEGRDRPVWSIPWRGHQIWGATAGILVQLSGILHP